MVVRFCCGWSDICSSSSAVMFCCNVCTSPAGDVNEKKVQFHFCPAGCSKVSLYLRDPRFPSTKQLCSHMASQPCEKHTSVGGSASDF